MCQYLQMLILIIVMCVLLKIKSDCRDNERNMGKVAGTFEMYTKQVKKYKRHFVAWAMRDSVLQI